MNRNDTELLRDVIIAYVDGRNIQSRRKGTSKWKDDDYPQFDSYAYDYRIKPEYRPFRSQDECYQSMIKNSPGCTVIDSDGNETNLSWVLGDASKIIWENIFRMAMKLYRFPDGTPFGAEVFK